MATTPPLWMDWPAANLDARPSVVPRSGGATRERADPMPVIDAKPLTDDALNSYDQMMVDCVPRIEKFSPLAVAIWSDVLRELDRRGFVELVSGSYDDVGNAVIRRK